MSTRDIELTRVVIVGKTKMRNQRCVGALGLDNRRSYRLLTSEGENFPMNTEFNLGQIWDLIVKPESNLTPPHLEDSRILWKQRVNTHSAVQLKMQLLNLMNAPVVAPRQIFDNCIRFTTHKKALIFLYGSKPQYSTGFWRLDKALHKRHDDKGRVRYLYCTHEMSCNFSDQDLVLDVPYVGCEAPIEFIPRDTLLRFSLSREYSAGKYIGFWLQLSGWFL